MCVPISPSSPPPAARGNGPNLTGSIAPGGTYLVQEAARDGRHPGAAGPDATGTIAMAAGAGTVAVTSSQTTLTCQTSADCQAAAVDLVGYGPTAAISETRPPGPSATVSDQRGAPADTDDNSADFATATPTPTAGGNGNPTPPPSPGRCASTTSRATGG